MKIALCEDEKIYIERILDLLKRYHTPDGENVDCDVYQNAVDLVENMQKENYDVLLLDIIMPGLNGIGAAREIRENDRSIPIIFLTSSPEFAVESYRVRAFDYLLKPVNGEELFRSLDDIYALKQSKKRDGLTVNLSKKGGIITISFEEIVYLEVNNKTLSFHLLNGKCMEVNGRISDYENIFLSRKNYLKPHRSFVVNIDYMKSYDHKCFIAITGESIPVARTNAKEVQNRYMEYLHEMIKEK